ncbi:hypothetical protein [Brenneria tiliae]|uniref:hypothetical protein n=1 Tax=Brenneria tiliae TaxID=2914984 RepID=UPI002014D998|nr:hypothetical protein [Brenneria tiliae]MCL2899783.1 hypothetical protein [Brenneria tiliae]MCL2904728.1 hypothetical protein [Brenneria tiliae]
MRIPTGNFGNLTPNPQPTRVNVSNAGAVGQAVQGLGKEIQQEVNAVVRARASESLLDYQIKIKDVNESIRQGVEDGSLRADQVEKVYQDAVGKLDKPQFSGLGIAEMQTVEGGLKRYESDGLSTARGYARTALKIEARDQVDTQLDQLGKLTNYPDADIEKINGMSASLEEQGRIAYGAQWPKVRQNWVDQNWYNQAQQRFLKASSSGAALSQLNNDLTSEDGLYLDKLDPNTRIELWNRVQNQQLQLQNQARIESARREALASRQVSEYASLVDNGMEPTDEMRAALSQTTRGTTSQSYAQSVLSDELAIKQAKLEGTQAFESLILNQKTELEKNGGTADQWQSLQRRSAAFQRYQEEQNQIAVMQRVESSIKDGVPLDPTDKNNQAAVDIWFQKNMQGFDYNDTNSINNLSGVVRRTGIIPSQVQSMFNAGAATKDPSIAVPMAKMFGGLFDNNPAAVASMPADTSAFFKSVYDYTNAGIPADKAVDTAYTQTYQQSAGMKEIISQKLRDKDYIKERDGAAQKNINEISPSLTSFGAPAITDPGVSNQQYLRDYRAIYDANFSLTGGDAKRAESITNAQVKNVWAVTSINGSPEVMKYAPEAVFGVSGAVNWMDSQWEKEKQELKSKSFGGKSDDTELLLVSDMFTARNQDYAVMVHQKNADGYDVRPYYGDNGLPIRFKFDQQTSPLYKAMQGIKLDRIEKAKQRREQGE